MVLIIAEQQRLQQAAAQQAAASSVEGPVSLPAALGGSGAATPTAATPTVPKSVSGFAAGVGGKPATPP